MATSIKNSLILLTFLAFIIIQGFCDCSLNNINIGTVRSGREIKGKPEWEVTVINNCSCSQSKIQLSCKGFQSSESVDPSVFAKQGDSCLLINGGPLKAFSSVNFSYAWDPPFLLLPSSSLVGHDCS
ncbi:uncharacterized protein LOC114730661 [Neltuma alba]|uniref:uncharacterized protein LOC114730661 n=1 Tax=Neltuma alba TaxID=207710 RepID=UPI0010A4BCA0|nr:uncharacterized protein LOC114730661 [Prosopis alba]